MKFKTQKKAIYLDHNSATVFDYKKQTTIHLKTIATKMDHLAKNEVSQNGESHFQNKEEELQNAFYQEIINEIENCKEIFLFGPATAKKELIHLIEKKTGVNSVKITIKDIDKLTEDQK